MNKLSLVPLQNTTINDRYWNKYISLIESVILPHQWNILSDQLEDTPTSHSLANFKIAAGREQGEFYGAVFQDTDVAKWLEAVGFSLATHPDQELEQTADEVIDIIGEAQCEDGYLNTYFTIKAPTLRFTNLQEGHELYTAGHLMEAAVAYYKSTGKDKFLRIMCRFADLICEVFSEEHNSKGYPGHQEIEIGLFKLYEVTGNERYLELAKSFIERRGMAPNYFLEEEKKPEFHKIFPELANYDPIYSQSHLPVREQTTAEGHAVRAVYMYCAAADIAAQYQDKGLLETCERVWNNIVNRRMYITGSIGSSGIWERFTTDYDLPNNCNYSETCASIGLALFSRRMAQIYRDSKYIDVAEKALYNTVLSGIAMDGKSFFYVNPLEIWPENCLSGTSKEHVKPVRQKWFGVSCCPPNIARTLSSLGEYIYFADAESIWINLFVSGSTKVIIDNHELRITVQTDFPNDGKVRIEVECDEKVQAKIAIRIPDYVEQFQVLLDGGHIEKQIEKGYLMIEREFGSNTIDVDFAIPPRVVHANPLVKEDIGKAAVMKGPVVYCLEEVDNGTNLPAYYLNQGCELKEEYSESMLGGTTVIKTVGKRITGQNWEKEGLYRETAVLFEDCPLTFVPYPYWGNRKTGEMLVWVKEFFNVISKED